MTKRKKITPKGESFYYFEATGNDYDIGKSKGQELAFDLADMWENFTLPKMEVWYGTPPEKYDATYKWLRKNLEQVAPWMVEQLVGMAAGSGLSLEQIFLTSHYGFLWSMGGIDDAVLSALQACSSITTVTSDTGPILAQNLEIGADDLYFVEYLKAQSGYATLSDGMLGMCCAPCGINSAGLAVGSSNFSAVSQREKCDLAFGTPYHFLPRIVLRQCGSVAEAVDLLKSLPDTIPAMGGYQLNMIDKSGAMAVVDKTNDLTIVRKCFDDFNFTTNCSLDEKTEEWRMGISTAERDNSKACYTRAEMLKSWYPENKGDVSLAKIKKLMRRHEMPGALCRHAPHEPNSYTRLSFLFFPLEGRMMITNGNSCCNDYQEFTLT